MFRYTVHPPLQSWLLLPSALFSLGCLSLQKNTIMSKHIKLYTDGGARGNPGPGGYGYQVIDSTSGAEIILEKSGNYLGTCTNNQAEYQGLLAGLRWVTDNLETEKLEIFMDSMLIVNQVKGQFKVKNQALKPLYQETMQLLKNFKNYSISHIRREQNYVADFLANQAMDSRARV